MVGGKSAVYDADMGTLRYTRPLLHRPRADGAVSHLVAFCRRNALPLYTAVLTVIDGKWLERTFGRNDGRATTAMPEEWAAPLRRLSPAEDEEIAQVPGVLVINKVCVCVCVCLMGPTSNGGQRRSLQCVRVCEVVACA